MELVTARSPSFTAPSAGDSRPELSAEASADKDVMVENSRRFDFRLQTEIRPSLSAAATECETGSYARLVMLDILLVKQVSKQPSGSHANAKHRLTGKWTFRNSDEKQQHTTTARWCGRPDSTLPALPPQSPRPLPLFQASLRLFPLQWSQQQQRDRVL